MLHTNVAGNLMKAMLCVSKPLKHQKARRFFIFSTGIDGNVQTNIVGNVIYLFNLFMFHSQPFQTSKSQNVLIVLRGIKMQH